MADQKVILGIDPGTRILGFGVISVTGRKARLKELDELLMVTLLRSPDLEVTVRWNPFMMLSNTLKSRLLILFTISS